MTHASDQNNGAWRGVNKESRLTVNSLVGPAGKPGKELTLPLLPLLCRTARRIRTIWRASVRVSAASVCPLHALVMDDGRIEAQAERAPASRRWRPRCSGRAAEGPFDGLRFTRACWRAC